MWNELWILQGFGGDGVCVDPDGGRQLKRLRLATEKVGRFLAIGCKGQPIPYDAKTIAFSVSSTGSLSNLLIRRTGFESQQPHCSHGDGIRVRLALYLMDSFPRCGYRLSTASNRTAGG
jgi:hypothetical protein